MRSRWLTPPMVAATLGLLVPACGGDDTTADPTPGTTTTNTGTGDCGNAVIDGTEACDGADLGGETCITQGLEGGELACSASCAFDLSSCTGCGNGTVEAPETCEPPGTAVCDASCQTIAATTCDEADTYDTDCAAAASGQWCWDGGDGGELFCGCDPEWGNVDCQVEGYGLCNPTTMACEATPECGSDTNEPNNDEAGATDFSTTTAGAGSVCEWDTDFFKFTAGDTAALVTLSWTSDSATDLDLAITDCAGTSLATGYSSELDQEVVAVADLESGTDYCVAVTAYVSPNNGTGDMDYSLAVEDRHSCFLDTDCSGGDVCPFFGASAGVCSATAPNAGCGDTVAGDNDTSSLAETLTSGVTVNEGTCDGEPDNTPDIDWFTFTVAAGDQFSLEVDQAGALTPGDVDLYLVNTAGEFVAASAATVNPELIAGAGLPAGTYYAFVYYYDNAQGAAADTYDITATMTAGSGCADRDDCANFIWGECSGSNVCIDFPGAGAQEPGDFCDSADDCNPNTTGTAYLSSACANFNPDRAADNVCSIDCAAESDCTAYGMHCLVVDAPDGLCIAPCLGDEDCAGGTCAVGTGICTL